MERLGMTHPAGDDFGHPKLAEGDPCATTCSTASDETSGVGE